MSDRSIERVMAFEALDSRGTPTVACVISLADGAEACATVPAGASTGRHEAHELRDGGERYGGRGVRTAVAAVNGEIAACLRGLDAADQPALDAALTALDGTPALGRLGSNAVLAASVACALAAAASARTPFWQVLAPASAPLLPRPMVNVLSGGAHADRAVDVQDVLVIPLAATTFRQAIEDAARVRAGTAAELRERGHPTALVADEGGLAALLETNAEALEIASRGIERSGVDAALALDVAATQLVHGSGYRLAREDRALDGAALAREIAGWARRFPLVSIEDPLGEDDWDAWRLAGELLPQGMQLLGDDLFATSCERIERGVDEGVANAVLIKPNQAGTLTGARKALDLAHREGYATVLSARSGESEDAWLADLAVGWRSGQIKVGSTQRSERTAKWNRLLRIEAERPDAELAPWRPAEGPSQYSAVPGGVERAPGTRSTLARSS